MGTSLATLSLLIALHWGHLPAGSLNDEELAQFRNVFHKEDGLKVGTVRIQENGISIRGLIPPSKLADMYRNKPTEIISLLGAIVEVGRSSDARKAMGFYYGLVGPPEAWIGMLDFDSDIDIPIIAETKSLRSIWLKEIREDLKARQSKAPPDKPANKPVR